MFPDPETPAGYRKMLRTRTREARLARGWSQAEIAGYMGLDVEVYKKYETRSPMPHHLVGPFCALVGLEIGFYMTGETTQKRAAIKRRRAVRG